MKIALFTFNLSKGAFAQGYAALASGFWKLGLQDISVVYLNSGPTEEMGFPEGVKFVPLDVEHARWSSFGLARFIRNNNPDLIIAMPVFINISAIIGWKLANRPRTKLFVSERATMSYKAFVEHKEQFIWRFIPSLVRILYPKASGLVANSEIVLYDLINNIGVPIPKNRRCVIPPAIDINKIQQLSKVEVVNDFFNQNSIPVIISAGRLEKQKNYPLLLRSIKLVQEKLKVGLLILGEGSQRGELEKLILELKLENTCLPGFQSNPWGSFSRSHLFVLSSEEEAFGRVLVEAMACGLPVISTDAIGGGPDFILGKGTYGKLVPNHDPTALAEGIIELLSSGDLREHLRSMGIQRSRLFEPENIAQQWLAFSELVGGF